LGETLGLDEPRRQLMAADGAALAVVLPTRAGEIAAYDALERQHLEPPAFGRAPVGPQREQMVRHDPARAREPEPGQSCQDASLVGDLGREDDVERRDPVAGNEQEPPGDELEQLANLPAPNVDGCL